MSTERQLPADRRAAGGGGRPEGGSGGGSRPTKNNRQGPAEGGEAWNLVREARDLPGDTGLRPLSVEPERRLREEAVRETFDGEQQARPWHRVVGEWQRWMRDYRSMHIEFEDETGQTVRTRLENSYQPEYGNRYYAKLKDLERGVEREYEGLTTVMLTFSASTRNANEGARCPADHMREVADGWDAARKQLHHALSGRRWEYAKVWEPTSGGTGGTGGYGHLHVAVFVEDTEERGEVEAGQFEAVMRSHVANCGPAGWTAHQPSGGAVSVREDLHDMACYISEYVGNYGEEALSRPVTEQMFYAVTWATRTRRVDFSNGAQDLMAREQFRRETGLRPEDRGGESFERWRSGEGVDGEASAWTVEAVVTVRDGEPDAADPTTGGVEGVAIAGRPGMDPPKQLGWTD